MTSQHVVKHEFVEFIPKERELGVIYVSIPYATSVHSCLCGCGLKVVTPLSPVGWSLTYDGETISLSPSVGNWNFPCRSHYIIRRNKVVWAADMTQEQIDRGRRRDKLAREKHFDNQPSNAPTLPLETKRKKRGWMAWLKNSEN